jgi:thiosulfate/3-mercaptopyruvate sulfurtransferase
MSVDLLVSTAWLADHLDDPTVRVVDIRGHVLPASEPPPHYFNHYEDYLRAHIPGAAFVDWVHEITDPADPNHARIAPPERYAAVMARIGVTDETHVIAYDDADGMFAARLWWSLQYYGHDRVSVLNGGWNRWIAEGRPTTDVIPTFPPATFTPRPRPELIRTGEQVLNRLGAEQILIDVRTPDEFLGRASRVRRAGHIPTARNLPRATLVGVDGLIPAPAALREQFTSAGVPDKGDDVVFYCNAGVSASYGLLLYRAAGFSGGAVYDGSWKDWGSDESKPIEV